MNGARGKNEKAMRQPTSLPDEAETSHDAGKSLWTVITSRRSAVEFSEQPIPTHVVELILHAGLSAPSSKNASPWRLHVVTDRTLIGEIADVVEKAPGAEGYAPADPSTGLLRQWSSTVAESAGFLRDCQVAVFVENRGLFSNGRQRLAQTRSDRMADALVGYTYETLGVGAAIQNMQLAASGFGLQSRFMGDVGVAESYIKDRLQIEVDLVGVVVLGYGSVVLPARPHSLDDAAQIVWHDADSTDKRPHRELS